jgi:hypothetical protein
MIIIRSNLNPNIDENNPETIESFIKYLKREQYGDHDVLDRKSVWLQSDPKRRKYSSTFDYFWNYQVNKMYVRYFLWNFVGENGREGNVDWMKFFGIPLIIGLFGAFYHFNKDWKNALAVFALFFMTGFAVILYLNQPDPQPRERDYSYAGSFFAFSIWIGIGVAGILEYLSELSGKENKLVPIAVSVLLLFIAPIQMLAKNYHSHNRTGNYVASDYSYNMLVSCEQDGVLYTNGDNDTFPLWYLQEVEKARLDVRVANLSLLNTEWYIKQLKSKEPIVPISLSEKEIDIMTSPEGFQRVLHWPNKRKIQLQFPSSVRESESKDFQGGIKIGDLPEKISFELGPKLAGRFLRVQDYMLLNTLYTNRFEKPIYFAVTTSNDNQLDGLRKYLRMDGLVLKVTTIPGWTINPDNLYDNLMNKFRYRNLDDPNVYYNPNIKGLLQNYRAAFSQLANYYLTTDDTTKFGEVVHKIFDVMPADVIPYTNPVIAQHLETYGIMCGAVPLEQLSPENYTFEQLKNIGQLSMGFKEFDIAKTAFEQYLQSNPTDVRTKGYLVQIYESLEDYDSAIAILEDWVAQNPQDKGAANRLEKYKELKVSETNNGSED